MSVRRAASRRKKSAATLQRPSGSDGPSHGIPRSAPAYRHTGGRPVQERPARTQGIRRSPDASPRLHRRAVRPGCRCRLGATARPPFSTCGPQHLRNEGFPVAGFNAWETDFSEDPFIALSTELTEGLEFGLDGSLAEKVADTKAVAGKVIRHVVPAAIRVATSGVLDIDRLLKAEERLSTYRKAKGSLDDFKAALGDMAAALAEARGGRPLIVTIDELDRCRPSYAVELLEVAETSVRR